MPEMCGRDIDILASGWNSDGELTSLGVQTPEESVTLLPEVVAIGLRERVKAAERALATILGTCQEVAHEIEDATHACAEIEGIARSALRNGDPDA